MRRFFVVLILALCTVPLALSAQAEATATAHAEALLHAGPERIHGVVGEVAAGEALRVIARDESGLWLLVAGDDGRGWLPTGFTTFAGDLRALPISDETLDAGIASPYATMAAATGDDTLLPLIARLMAVPLLHNLESGTIPAIAARGIAAGRDPQVFTRVGDSDTTSGDFLRPIGMRGDFCDLGPYAHLQATVGHFAVPPREPFRNSFDATSLAARNGFTMVAVMDPAWATDDACFPNEAPLACEFRLAQPIASVIMLGRMDVQYFDADFYAQNVRRVIEAHIDAGVIPILTTFVVLPDNADYAGSLAFNNVLVDLADEYAIPLVNLWRGVQTLPGYGIGPDLTHLSHALGEFCAFTGAEMTYGGTLRNLLTLLALDAVRRAALDSE